MGSDNAVCYHSHELICILPFNPAKHHLNLASYNFIEPQLGTGICDRKISVIKRALIQYIEDGNDIKSILDMNNALILIIT